MTLKTLGAACWPSIYSCNGNEWNSSQSALFTVVHRLTSVWPYTWVTWGIAFWLPFPSWAVSHTSCCVATIGTFVLSSKLIGVIASWVSGPFNMVTMSHPVWSNTIIDAIHSQSSGPTYSGEFFKEQGASTYFMRASDKWRATQEHHWADYSVAWMLLVQWTPWPLEMARNIHPDAYTAHCIYHLVPRWQCPVDPQWWRQGDMLHCSIHLSVLWLSPFS